jgi:hypothetical protein
VAALTPTYLTGKLPVGHKVIRVVEFTIANADAADEWIDTGLSWIDGVVGCVPANGTAELADFPVFKRNCGSGTGGTQDTAADGGLLSVEGTAGVWNVTVIGKA